MKRPANLRAASGGFTLIELLTVLTVVAVLLTIAIPSFRELILTQYVRAGASDLQTALYFARSEAIKRAGSVEVVPTSSKWEKGWTVQVAGGGDVLRKQNALSDQVASMSGSTITFLNNGRATAATTPIPAIVFQTSNPKVIARCVAVDLSGRPSVVYDTDGDASNGCN
jgi:type IV fimbrial biogenesis protein FimT